jgi:hypothetical protein
LDVGIFLVMFMWVHDSSIAWVKPFKVGFNSCGGDVYVVEGV